MQFSTRLAYFSPVAYERHRRSPVVGSFLIEAGGLVEDQLFIRVTAQVTAIVNNQQYMFRVILLMLVCRLRR
jgi:hypothetical protein